MRLEVASRGTRIGELSDSGPDEELMKNVVAGEEGALSVMDRVERMGAKGAVEYLAEVGGLGYLVSVCELEE